MDPKGYKYIVAQYAPDPHKAAADKHHEEFRSIVCRNNGKKIEDRTPVCMVGDEFFINNKPVRCFIQPQSPIEVCKAKFDYSQEMKSFKLLPTRPFPENGSVFQGFAIRAKSLLAVDLGYCKAHLTVPAALHIMCAYDVAQTKDSCDNSEHHGGLQIAKMLECSKHQEVAIYVTRQTQPELLGPKRFQILDRVADKNPVDECWPQHSNQPPPADFNVKQRLAAFTNQPVDQDETSLKTVNDGTQKDMDFNAV